MRNSGRRKVTIVAYAGGKICYEIANVITAQFFIISSFTIFNEQIIPLHRQFYWSF
jgi:hypothetical protein